MAKTLTISTIAFMALICTGLSCSNCSQNGDGNTCHGGKRSVRAAENQVQEILLTFDVKLTEELANEISQMGASDKESFLQDLRKMNEAAEAEYKSLRGAKSSLSQQELVETVANKVSQDFSSRNWYKRLQSLAGDKINHLINNPTENSDI